MVAPFFYLHLCNKCLFCFCCFPHQLDDCLSPTFTQITVIVMFIENASFPCLMFAFQLWYGASCCFGIRYYLELLV